jgi:DNA-binding response OmpR family regulator
LVLERIRNLAGLAATPVIVLSARNPVDNRKRSLDAGAVNFFQKPPDIHEFLSAIRQALGETIALSTFLKT